MSMEPVPLDNPTPPSSEKRRTVLREALGVFAVVALIAWALLRFFTGVPGEHRFSLHAPSQAAVCMTGLLPQASDALFRARDNRNARTESSGLDLRYTGWGRENQTDPAIFRIPR